MLQRVYTGATRKNSPSVLSCIVKKQEKAVAMAMKSGQFTADETVNSFSDEIEGIWQKREL